MGRDPAAIRHGLVHDGDRPPIHGLHDDLEFFPETELGRELGPVSIGVKNDLVSLDPVLQERLQGAAGPHDLARQIVHLEVTIVADDNPLVRIEHDEALRHIVEGGVEPGVLELQVEPRAVQRIQCPVQNPQWKDPNDEIDGEAEKTTGQGGDGRVDRQWPRTGGDLDMADGFAADDDRRRSPHRRTGRCGTDLNDDLVRLVDDALLVASNGGFRHFDQVDQANGVVLPQLAVAVDVFREPVGLELRLECEIVRRRRIFDEQITGRNRNGGDDRHE